MDHSSLGFAVVELQGGAEHGDRANGSGEQLPILGIIAQQTRQRNQKLKLSDWKCDHITYTVERG